MYTFLTYSSPSRMVPAHMLFSRSRYRQFIEFAGMEVASPGMCRMLCMVFFCLSSMQMPPPSVAIHIFLSFSVMSSMISLVSCELRVWYSFSSCPWGE